MSLNKIVKVAVSGYFDPIHIGHLLSRIFSEIGTTLETVTVE